MVTLCCILFSRGEVAVGHCAVFSFFLSFFSKKPSQSNFPRRRQLPVRQWFKHNLWHKRLRSRPNSRTMAYFTTEMNPTFCRKTLKEGPRILQQLLFCSNFVPVVLKKTFVCFSFALCFHCITMYNKTFSNNHVIKFLESPFRLGNTPTAFLTSY